MILKLILFFRGNMKKSKYIFYTLIIIVLILSMHGCNTSKIYVNVNQNSSEYVFNEDSQNFLDTYSKMVKVDNGYYFINNNHLYFLDGKSYNTTLACNKINCKHNDDGCTAFFSILNFYPLQLAYYNNALYVIGWKTEGANIHHNYVYQISLDNFKRKKAAFLYNGSGMDSIIFVIHRGYIYFTYGNSSMKESTMVLYRTKLGNIKKNASEEIFNFTAIGSDIFNLNAYGNQVFFTTASYHDENGNGYNTSLNSIDIHTLETKIIIKNNLYSYFVDKEFVYYEKDQNTVNKIKLNTNDETFFCKVDGPAYISADDNYIYFDNLQSIIIGKTDEKDRRIFVYDKSGKYITEIIPKNPKDDCYFGGDDIMIFKEKIEVETTESNGENGYYLLDKSQLSSSNKQFIDME